MEGVASSKRGGGEEEKDIHTGLCGEIDVNETEGNVCALDTGRFSPPVFRIRKVGRSVDSDDKEPTARVELQCDRGLIRV